MQTDMVRSVRQHHTVGSVLLEIGVMDHSVSETSKDELLGNGVLYIIGMKK